MSDRFHQALEPATIRIRRDDKGRPIHVHDGEEKLVYQVARAFPLSTPEDYVSLLDEDGKELGMIHHMGELDDSSKTIVAEELEKAYFIPRIKKILRLKEVYGGVTDFSVETDRGYRDFEVRGREGIRLMGLSRIIITDVDGNKYEVPDSRGLDSRSRSLLGWMV
jgi:hypothetical protein